VLVDIDQNKISIPSAGYITPMPAKAAKKLLAKLKSCAVLPSVSV
jgi:hypothetical protein